MPRDARLPLAICLLATLLGCGGEPACPVPGLPASMHTPVRTAHLLVHTDLRGPEREFQLAVLEGLYAWFDAHWLPLPAQPEPLRVLLFADSDGMRAWNAQVGLDDAMGRLVQLTFKDDPVEHDLLVVDASTGLGTGFHELVHYCLKLAAPRERPVFVEEGVASFFEKFLGWLDDDGALHLTVGYLHPGRYLSVSNRHPEFDVAAMWTVDRAGFDYGAARSFMLFLHRRGWLRPFVLALPGAAGDGRAELEAIAGRTLAELDAEWHAWIEANPYVLGGDATLVERSTVLDAVGWQRWQDENRERLRFDDALGIWRVRGG
ncbi:MAG: hypothetical protein AB7O97_01630 [Planctomycetota bacterium]